jgi:hypothetical protein
VTIGGDSVRVRLDNAYGKVPLKVAKAQVAVRSRAAFDGVLDFDSVVRDAADGDLIAAPFNCDGIHPTPRGYFEMGKAISLDLFAR